MPVSLRELRDDEFPDWLETGRRFYVGDLVHHAGMTQREAEGKAERDHRAVFPDGRPTEGQHLFVIEDDEGSPIGRLFFAMRPSGAWLYEIELDEAVRGRGLGREAMLAFETRVRELGAEKVTLNVFGGNQIARSLYRSLGYVEESVQMRKRLGGALGALTVSERLEQLYAIGGGPGANRPHPSPAEDEAHRIAATWLEAAGLEIDVDADGNLVGRSGGRDDVWTGSHLDSVPRGGRFDGALGVVAAIEAVERVGAGSVVVFRGEEIGCVGSRALVAHGGPLPSAFLELHIEQGPVLADADVPLGVVTGIVGYARGELVLEGRAGHAGTTPMAGREDALVAAAAEIQRVRDAGLAVPGGVATIGQVEVEPGGVNVIPSRVRLSLDVRAPDRDRLDALIAAIGFEPDYVVEPVQFAGDAAQALRDSIAARGLDVVELPSGAGHDAGILAAAGVDAAMLFVRSLNGGVSHSPDELSSDEDVALATDVLTEALRRLVS